MIQKVYEVDPLLCPRCGGVMKVVAFLTEYAVVDRIICHRTLTFAAEKPPPAGIPGPGFRVLDTCPGPRYLHFMRGRIDSEPEAGGSMPRKKKFLFGLGLGGHSIIPCSFHPYSIDGIGGGGFYRLEADGK